MISTQFVKSKLKPKDGKAHLAVFSIHYAGPKPDECEDGFGFSLGFNNRVDSVLFAIQETGREIVQFELGKLDQFGHEQYLAVLYK